MSAIGDAQQRALDDAQVTWADAIGALDKAKAAAEGLHEAHLLADQDFWEAVGAIDGLATVLEDLREFVLTMGNAEALS